MHGHDPNAKMTFINNYTDIRLLMQIIVHFIKDLFNSVRKDTIKKLILWISSLIPSSLFLIIEFVWIIN